MEARRVLAGALAGCVATVPMTVTMVSLHRLLPWAERYPLPPAEVTPALLERAGVPRPSDPTVQVALTLLGHFSYGAAAGAVWGALPPVRRVPPVVAGVAFGLMLWAFGYVGWLPAAGILRHSDQHPARRNALMLAAHAVWGAATALP